MRKHKILVVDDEHLIRWSLEQNLKKQGYEVTQAASGEDALKLVSEDIPDLVLLDIQLPGINGLDVLEKIKEIDSVWKSEMVGDASKTTQDLHGGPAISEKNQAD